MDFVINPFLSFPFLSVGGSKAGMGWDRARIISLLVLNSREHFARGNGVSKVFAFTLFLVLFPLPPGVRVSEWTVLYVGAAADEGVYIGLVSLSGRDEMR